MSVRVTGGGEICHLQSYEVVRAPHNPWNCHRDKTSRGWVGGWVKGLDEGPCFHGGRWMMTRERKTELQLISLSDMNHCRNHSPFLSGIKYVPPFISICLRTIGARPCKTEPPSVCSRGGEPVSPGRGLRRQGFVSVESRAGEGRFRVMTEP